MSLCKIVELIQGIEYRAKSVAGVWRALAEDDSLVDGESVKVFSAGAEFNKNAYKLQSRTSATWVDAETVSLDLPSGTSHTRTDKLDIDGDATNSTVTIAVTHSKGHAGLKMAHLGQLHAEDFRGIRFTWKGGMYAGVLSEITKSKENVPGGYMDEADARLVCNREQFIDAGKMPLIGQTLTASGEQFVITGIDVSDTIYSLELRRDDNA